MTDQQHTTNERGAEHPSPEPSIPESHDSIELSEDTIIVYDRKDTQRWICADTVVRCAEFR